ncbi:MAG: DUF2089 family protein [Phycisphaerae bacterium]|jgi:hypothetical protein
MKVLPTTCPSCSSQLSVKSLVCQQCQTEIQGQYELPLLSRLSLHDQGFIIEFIKASGSLKEMARLMGLSYPTVRNRLDEIIEHIKPVEKSRKDGKEKKV